MLENPFLCIGIVLVLFCLLTAGCLWVDTVPRDRKKHKRIKNVRRLK